MIDYYAFDIETTGFNPFKNKVIAIGIGKIFDGGKSKYYLEWKSGEKKILRKFFKYLSKIPDNNPIYGYNIARFDIPFLFTRAVVLEEYDYITHEVEFGNINHTKLLSDKCFIDLMQTYVMNVFWRVGFDRLLARYNVKRRHPQRGENIPLLYHAKKYDDILNHLRDDITTTKKLVKIKMERGHLPHYDYDANKWSKAHQYQY